MHFDYDEKFYYKNTQPYTVIIINLLSFKPLEPSFKIKLIFIDINVKY